MGGGKTGVGNGDDGGGEMEGAATFGGKMVWWGILAR